MNDLQKLNSTNVSSAETVNQQANRIYNIEKAGSVTTGAISNTTNIFIASNKQSPLPSNTDIGQSRDYYNLFVMGGEEFALYSNGYFMVPKERALTEYMSEDIKDSVNSLTSDAIRLLQTFPAIFCSENDEYGKAGDSQVAYFGYVTGISVQDNGIKIHYLTIKQIPQTTFNENLDEFSLRGTTSFNELNRTHWCVKRNNLYESLHDANIMI